MTQKQYDSLCESLDTLLRTGKIDQLEHAERMEKINQVYVSSLHFQNTMIAQREA